MASGIRPRLGNRPRLALRSVTMLLLLVLTPALAQTRKGSLAVVNLKEASHTEAALEAQKTLAAFEGGWAREPGLSRFLAGLKPESLPAGDTGEELVRLVGRIRAGGQPVLEDLGRLGQLLAVDYLVLVKVKDDKGETVSARLFSVAKGQYAPQGFEAERAKLDGLRDYVLHQTGLGDGDGKKKTRWWIWAIAGALAVAGLVLALTLKDDSTGDLTVRVTR